MKLFERTDYLYFGPLCVLVDTYIEPGLKLGLHIGLKPPCIDLYAGWWMISITSREHGLECQGYEKEQAEIEEALQWEP